MPVIEEADEGEANEHLDDANTGVELPASTLAQMRAVLGRCGAGLELDSLPAEMAGPVLARVDRPLLMAQVSKRWRTAVLGAKPRLPLRYVVDPAKYHASVSTDKNAEMLADLAAKCGQYDVVAITISRLHLLFTDASGLSALLPRCPNLASLDLSNNVLRVATLTGLRACTALTTLDLSWVIDNVGNPAWLAGALPATLRELHLKGVNLDDETSIEGLSAALDACPGLVLLDLQQNNLRTSGALARMLPKLSALEHLDLSSARLNMTALRDAASSLRACTALTHLDVADLDCDSRRWGDDPQSERVQAQNLAGVEFLDMLPSWPALKFLGLSRMYVGPDATHLAAALLALPALTHLDLEQCRIGSQGTRNIAAALPAMPRLAHLNLYSCETRDIGVQALVAVLPQCQALMTLRLGHNHITGASAEGVVGFVSQCPNLTKLNMRPSDFDQESIEAIVAAWRAQHEPRGECTFETRGGSLVCEATHFEGREIAGGNAGISSGQYIRTEREGNGGRGGPPQR